MIVAAARTVRADLLASSPQLYGIHDIRVCSGGQAEDLGKVAIDQRQFFDRVSIDDSSESGVLCLKERRLGANRDLFLCAADRELNLHPAHLGDLNLNTIQDEWLESCRTHRYVIAAAGSALDP